MNNLEYRDKLKKNNIDEKLYDYLYKCLLDEDRLDELDKCIDMLICGRPIQYVVGNVDFYGNKINVDENVLIPRFETELLVEKTVKYINKIFDREVSIIDIGTGSGCIAISLSKLVKCRMSAIDISNEALEVARGNALYNKVDIDFHYSDVFSDVEGTYDVIISNPPYIRYDEEIMDIVRDNEPERALYASCDGLYFYKEILNNCSRYLNEKFLICFEIGYEQGEDIKKLSLKYLKDINISVEKDYSEKDRYVFIWN